MTSFVNTFAINTVSDNTDPIFVARPCGWYENTDYSSFLRYNSLSATLKLILLDYVAQSPPFNLSTTRHDEIWKNAKRSRIETKIILQSDVLSLVCIHFAPSYPARAN